MINKNQKRLIVIVIAFIVSAFIWNVNASWKNTFFTCFILSTTTFLIIFAPFEIYFCWRDIWSNRWDLLFLKDLEILRKKINVEGGILHGDLVKSKNQALVKSKNAIVVISPGYSDTKESLQNYYFPLAYNGYVILTYDVRGVGESKKTGNRSDFIKKIEDFKKIIEWIKSNEDLSQMRIFCIGVSIGASTVLCGGFPDKTVEKIVAISSISNHKQNIQNTRSIVKFSYRMKGVNLSPNNEENKKLSPYLVMKNLKEKLSSEEWKNNSKRVMLIHPLNDQIIKFKNFEENREILELSDENQLILRKGGHSQKKNELIIVGATLKFFNS